MTVDNDGDVYFLARNYLTVGIKFFIFEILKFFIIILLYVLLNSIRHTEYSSQTEHILKSLVSKFDDFLKSFYTNEFNKHVWI